MRGGDANKIWSVLFKRASSGIDTCASNSTVASNGVNVLKPEDEC